MSEHGDRLGKDGAEHILREAVIPESGLDALSSHEKPRAVVLAGQPGAGKGRLTQAIELEFSDDVLVIDPDRLRDNIPNVRQLQEADPIGWPEKTNKDAFRLANGLRDEGIKRQVNIVIDGSMSDADNSIRTIRALQKKGYEVEVRAMSAHWLESELGIDRRFTKDIDKHGVARDVGMDFHNRVYDALPDNLDKVSQATGVPVRIYDRDLNELYDSRRDPTPPGAVLREMRSGSVEDPHVRSQLEADWKQQRAWHQTMPEAVRARGDVPAAAADALVAGHAERGMLERAAARSESLGAIDAPAPISEPVLPRLNRAGTVAGLAGMGAAAAAYDASQTGLRIGTAYDQDNPSAARSEATHLLARGAGGLAAGFAPLAVGASGGPALALVVADGYLLTEAFDRGAKLLDRERIVRQTDRQDVSWEFNGRQWVREDLKADLRDDGQDAPQRQRFSAPADTARELSYLASIEAVSQAIGKAEPRNPFVQPAHDSDPAHLKVRDWTRDPDSGRWSRSVADELNRNDAPVWKPDPEYASPARAAELDRQASQTIDRNIVEGPAASAARYQIGHKRNGFDHEGPEPPVVTTALNPDTLEGSDGKQYARDAQGRWSHEGQFASGNLALELAVTRERLIPALQQHQARLAEVPSWQPPTPEQYDRDALRLLYANHGVNPNPERFEAAYQAVQRTREAEGIGPATTSLALEPSAGGGFDVNSTLQHLRLEPGGVVRIAATTRAEDIQRAQLVLDGAEPAVDRQGERETRTRTNTPEPAAVTPRRIGPEPETPTADPVAPDFAPGQRGARDLREPEHEGHAAYRDMQHKAKVFEAQQGIPHGPHTDRLAASMLQFAVENGLRHSSLFLERNQGSGQMQLRHAPYDGPTQRFDADLAKLSSQPIETSSQRVNEAVSGHYAHSPSAAERTREQARSLGELSFDDKLLFARIRGGAPAHISDDHVGQAMVAAKKNGMDANSVSHVSMVGNQLRVAEAGPAGRSTLLDVNAQAPPLQACIQQANTLNQQDALARQQATTQQQTQQQDELSSQKMLRSM